MPPVNEVYPHYGAEYLMILFTTTSSEAMNDLEAWGHEFPSSHVETLSEIHTILFVKPGIGRIVA